MSEKTHLYYIICVTHAQNESKTLLYVNVKIVRFGQWAKEKFACMYNVIDIYSDVMAWLSSEGKATAVDWMFSEVSVGSKTRGAVMFSVSECGGCNLLGMYVFVWCRC